MLPDSKVSAVTCVIQLDTSLEGDPVAQVANNSMYTYVSPDFTSALSGSLARGAQMQVLVYRGHVDVDTQNT